MPITQAVLDTATHHPYQPVIVGDDGHLTYASLVENSRRLFAVVDALHQMQIAPPVPAVETAGIPITAVSLSSAFHASRIIAGLAGFRAVSATVDPQWVLEHRIDVIFSTGIGVVISDCTDLADGLKARGWMGTIVTLAEFMQYEASAVPAVGPTVRDGKEPFLLLFSSGTTSHPKAFLKTRRQYRDNFAVSSAYLEPWPGVATFAPGPVSYSLTLYALIECLASGGSAHVMDVFDPLAMRLRIRDAKITRVVAVPAVVHALVDVARRDPAHLTTLELVVTGGANLSATLRTKFAEALPHVRLISYYGAAEIGFIGDSRGGDGTRISVYEGINVSIRDDHGAEVSDGEPGTLWVHAPACSDGYLPQTTDAVLKDSSGWATVRDQGRFLDGVLVLEGRAGDIVVTGGHKVALSSVEVAFEEMPHLGAVCAVAIPHDRLGAVVALTIEGEAPAKQQLLSRAREQLAPQFVPRRWYWMPRLPRTVGGKIRRTAVADLIAQGEAERL